MIKLISCSLYSWVQDFLDRKVDLERSARIGSCLVKAGLSVDSCVFQRLRQEIISAQLNDGGWKSVEESIWCLKFLYTLNSSDIKDESIVRASNWLLHQKSKDGGIGFSFRDFSRIPLTSWMFLLLPDLMNRKDADWLKIAVKKELSFPFFLTYKLSLPIFALRKVGMHVEDEDYFLHKLSLQQNEDGGFSPWRNHPIGSEIVSSSYALCAFLGNQRYVKCYEACLNWIKNNQLSDGFWPYHYLDYGACIGIFALTEVKK